MTIRIQAHNIIGTKLRIFSAWEPTELMGNHGTICTLEGDRFGRIGTNRNLPADVAALTPGSDERIAAVRAWYETHYQRAYDAILAAHPETVGGKRRMGEIEIVL